MELSLLAISFPSSSQLFYLNFTQNMFHHHRSLGGWSWAFRPYWEEGLTAFLDTTEVDTLIPLIDVKGKRTSMYLLM